MGTREARLISENLHLNNELPFVSIVMPCRNELEFLDRAVRSLLAGNYPPDRFEILIVEGCSDDGTQVIAAQLARDYPAQVRMLTNPSKTTPTARNIGVSQATGELIAFADAHAEYPANYLEALVCELQNDSEVAGAGVLINTVPGAPGVWPQCIALAMSMPFGVGNSHSRIGVAETRDVDTIFGGIYRRSIFQDLGCFRTNLIRGQDDEFNHRLIKSGRRLRIVPAVSVNYFARTSLGQIARMTFQYGLFKPLAGKLVGRATTWRQFIPPAFVMSLGLGTLGLFFSRTRLVSAVTICALMLLHIAAGLTMTALQKRKRNNQAHLAGTYIAALTMHLAYGIGYLTGAAKVLLGIHNKVDYKLTR